MTYRFTKMQGAGNDYIYLNCLQAAPPDAPEELARQLSDRHFGVGGDGLVLILPSQTADARMRMFNADGSEGGMCGNAIRCVGKYLYDNRLVLRTELRIETKSGVLQLTLFAEDSKVYAVRVNMGQARLSPADIPVRLGGDRIVAHGIEVGGCSYEITCVSMGNPHAVVFCDIGSVDSLPLASIGPLFETNPVFPQGVNTEFVEVITSNRLHMRVWERGSGETLACGTGACAAAVAAVLNGHAAIGSDITVRLRGGELIIRYETDGTVLMTGGCETVFEGSIEA